MKRSVPGNLEAGVPDSACLHLQRSGERSQFQVLKVQSCSGLAGDLFLRGCKRARGPG